MQAKKMFLHPIRVCFLFSLFSFDIDAILAADNIEQREKMASILETIAQSLLQAAAQVLLVNDDPSTLTACFKVLDELLQPNRSRFFDANALWLLLEYEAILNRIYFILVCSTKNTLLNALANCLASMSVAYANRFLVVYAPMLRAALETRESLLPSTALLALCDATNRARAWNEDARQLVRGLLARIGDVRNDAAKEAMMNALNDRLQRRCVFCASFYAEFASCLRIDAMFYRQNSCVLFADLSRLQIRARIINTCKFSREF